MIIEPFLALCKDMITQSYEEISQVWKECKQYLISLFNKFEDEELKKESINEIKKVDLMQYVAKGVYYGIMPNELKKLQLEDTKNVDLDKFY